MSTFAGMYGPEPCLDSDGRLLKSTLAYVYVHGTTTPTTLYTDRTKAQTTPNPTVSDPLGNLTFFAVPGEYDVLVNTTTLSVTVERDPLDFFDDGTVVGLAGNSELIVQLADGTNIVSDFLLSYSPIIGDNVKVVGTTVVGKTAGSGSQIIPLNASVTTPTLAATTAYTLPGLSLSASPGTNASVTTPTLAIGTTYTVALPVIAAAITKLQTSPAAISSGTSCTLVLPNPVTVGSRLIACFTDPVGANPVLAGWTVDASSGYKNGAYVLSHVTQAGDGQSYTFTMGGSDSGGIMYEYSGTTGVAGASTSYATGSTANGPTAPTVTPSTAKSLSILAFGVSSTTASSLTYTAGQTFTNDLALGGLLPTGGGELATAHLILAAASGVTTTIGYTAGGAGAKSSDLVIAVYNGSSAAPGSAATMQVTGPAVATVGQALSFTVSAIDSNNNVATGYTGTVHFTSSDAAATLPANTTLVNGTGTFTVTFNTAGTQTLTATDTVTGTITGTSGNCVVSSAANAGNRFRLSSGVLRTGASAAATFATWCSTYLSTADKANLPNGQVFFHAENAQDSGGSVYTAMGNIVYLGDSPGGNYLDGRSVPGFVLGLGLAWTDMTIQQVAAGALDNLLLTSGGSFTNPKTGLTVSGAIPTLKAIGFSPLVIRLGWEAGPLASYYTWNNSGANAFIAAFQHVSTLLKNNIPGVLIDYNGFSFNSFGPATAGYTIAQTIQANETWYPGDAYVDVISVDAYDRGTCGPPNAADQLFLLQACQQMASNHAKYWGCGEFGWQEDNATSFANDKQFIDSNPADGKGTGAGGHGGVPLYMNMFQDTPGGNSCLQYNFQYLPNILAAYQTRMASA